MVTFTDRPLRFMVCFQASLTTSRQFYVDDTAGTLVICCLVCERRMSEGDSPRRDRSKQEA
jgi:hypothetical protein